MATAADVSACGDDADARAFQAVSAAVFEGGGFCHTALRLQQPAGGSRGVFTAESLAAGELLIRVPLALSLVVRSLDTADAVPAEEHSPSDIAGVAVATVVVVPHNGLADVSTCRCHPEDAIRWGVYSGDYVRLTCQEAVAYAVVNPPPADSDSDEDDVPIRRYQDSIAPTPPEGEIWVASALHQLLRGGTTATIDLVDLKELVAVRVDAAAPWERSAASAFFGTVDATRQQGHLQEVADAADIEVDDDVAQYWQRYVDDERCHMRPAWPGLSVSASDEARASAVVVGAGVVARDASAIKVTEAIDHSGERVAAGFVGPRTRVESSGDSKAIQSLHWVCRLATRLLQEAERGDASCHQAHLRTMPSSPEEGLWAWSGGQLAELGNAELESAASSWSILRQRCIEFVSFDTAQDVERCIDLVVTRAAVLRGPDDTILQALVPVFDLVNHGPSNIEPRLEGDCVEVRTLGPIAPGAELLLDFGLTVEQCLVVHGFLPDGGATNLYAPCGVRLRIDAEYQVDGACTSADSTAAWKAFVHACDAGIATIARAAEAGDANTAHAGDGVGALRASLASRYRSWRRRVLERTRGNLVASGGREK